MDSKKTKKTIIAIIIGIVALSALVNIIISLTGNLNAEENNTNTATEPARISIRDLSNGEYQIESGIKIYDSNLRQLQARITYTPNETFVGKNALFIYANNSSLGFGDRNRPDFIDIISKCIEWSTVARENNLHATRRFVKEDVNLIGTTTRLEPFYADFIFSISEISNKEEHLLIINYRTTNEDNMYRQSNKTGRQGRYIVFKIEDLDTLKQILSDNFLSQIDNMEIDKNRKEELLR
jgi:hypothetical protein